MKTKFFILILFLISIILISCAKETTVVQQPAAQGAGQPAAAQAQPSEQAKAGLTNLLVNKIKTYKVTYSIATSETENPASEMTMYYSGSDKVRIDTSGTSGGQQMSTSLYILAGKTYICTEKPQKMCIQQNTEANPEVFTGQEDVEKNLESYSIMPLPSRTIAAVNSQCYRITVSGGEMIDSCYSSGGIMLYTKTRSSEMTAKSFTTNVPDSDFTLPAQPQSLEAYQAGITANQ